MLAVRRLSNPKWVKSRKLLIDPTRVTGRFLELVKEVLPGAQGESRQLLESALTPRPDAEVKPLRKAGGSRDE